MGRVTVRYVYLGDRMTRLDLRGAECDPIRRADGRAIVSTPRATAKVVFEDGSVHVVARRRLRLKDKYDARESRQGLSS